jgi:hypothetical protein
MHIFWFHRSRYVLGLMLAGARFELTFRIVFL